jgi:hypothetical protein
MSWESLNRRVRKRKVINTAASLPLLNMRKRLWWAETSMRTFISYEQLSDSVPSLEQLITDMQSFEAHDLLFFGSKIGLTLQRDDGLFSERFQTALAQDFLPDAQLERYVTLQNYFAAMDFQRGVNVGIRPIVSPLHVLNFLKLILCDHKFEGNRMLWMQTDPTSGSDAFRLLLGFGAYLARTVREAGEHSTRALFCELTRNSLLMHRGMPDRLLARYGRLFFTLAANESGSASKDRIDIPAVFRDATGLDLQKLFSLGISLLAVFAPASRLNFDEDSPTGHVDNFVFNYEQFFKDVNVSADELELLKKYFSITVQEARTRFQERRNPAKAFEYDVQPFIEKPILDLPNGFSIVSSFSFLIERFTIGVFWTLFDHLKTGENTPGNFEKYWGNLCQVYVEDLVKADVLTRGQYRIIPFFDPLYEKGKKKTEARGSDIILFDEKKRELFLFELTYSALRLETLFNEDNVGALDDGFKKIVQKARQLNTVIQDIKSGELKLPGLPLERIRKFRPYVVTMSYFPIWPFTMNDVGEVWQGFNSRVAAANLLQDDDVEKLGLMNVDDFEELCAWHRGGVSMFILLREWSKSKRFSDEILHNFLLSRTPRKRNYRTLRGYYKEIAALSRTTLFGEVAREIQNLDYVEPETGFKVHRQTRSKVGANGAGILIAQLPKRICKKR